MSDDPLQRDSERASLLHELLTTPVGRRWVLKAGLGSAAAVAAASLPVWSATAVGPSGQASGGSGSPSGVTLQFALGPAFAVVAPRSQASPSGGTAGGTSAPPSLPTAGGVSDLVLVANGARLPLVPHTADSREALRAQGGLWASMDLNALTHYVADVPLPADRGMLTSVLGRRGRNEVLVSQLFYAPPAATRALAQAAHGLSGSLGSVVGAPERLAALGLSAAQVSSPEHVVQLDTIGDTYQTATAMSMIHPNVATVAPTETATTKALVGPISAVANLGQYITTMQAGGSDVATLVSATDPDGSPSQIKIGGTTTTFSTVRLNQDDAQFRTHLRSAVRAAVPTVRDDARLGAVIDKPLDESPAASTKTWVQSQGVTPQHQVYCPTCLGGGIDIKVKNGGDLFGTKTVVTGGYSGGKVPLRIYNNWVRWMWVYVQYLGKDGTNVSANPNATLPDTKYSKSLAMLPQVFTVLGIPVWDQNTIDVTLDFPQDAHTARLLYCGLGADIHGLGWSQYFPAGAYDGAIAPTDEVLVPALLTGILTIGLTAFALTTDLDIAATWDQVRKLMAEGAPMQVVMRAVSESLAGTLTGAEALALATASGQATYLDIKNHGENVDNLWTILLGVASVIPKIIFNPHVVEFWLEVAGIVLANIGLSKVELAIPIIGEAIAILEALGDVATLAEVTAETVIAPWVIENEVNLTYQATVTIDHDTRASEFPATARSWRLEALVDGATTLDPITDTINEGGRIRSDPLVLTVTAPFGGKQIQWSIVMVDEEGHQVATGVSAQYPNDDPNNPPAEVAFAITEIPASITAATVFKRADTTTYSTAVNGYTWSDQVPDAGTAADRGGLQDVLGAAVATRAAVAGLVWKQDDRYYLRGVPVAQNDPTIDLRPAPKEGYAHPPFLLFDAFVAAGDVGNHVLLEPDETSASGAYHVRKLTLDSVTGALSWDPTVSYGMFTLPVSAAALHSSGRVVAVHTDSGRFGWLQPVNTPRPQLAAYSAGKGTQTGLLQSPVAVAVTNPGVVLVLEQGAFQLAAFDLNGNPVKYFGSDPDNLHYTQPLPSTERHYLDLAVDGASQIYVLSYTGDSPAPEDYRVDVYTQAGEPLDTNSPGVNVAHLAVDYWRSIYGANYDPLIELGTTTPRIDPALGVAEPSLSRFDPT